MAKPVSILLLSLFFGGISYGQTSTFTTASGATTSGGAVDATAMFTTGNGFVDVTLTNLESNPTAVSQTISDLSFAVSGATGAATYSSSQPTTTQINVNSDRSYSTPTPTTGTTYFAISTKRSTVTLDALANGGKGGTTPAGEIIGAPGPGNTYSNANSSIIGNGPHNPFLNQTATFDILLSNVTSGSTISNVVFSFGTTPEYLDGVPGPTPPAVPEPSSIWLLSGVVAYAGFLVYRRGQGSVAKSCRAR